MKTPRWRVGTKLGRTLYRDGQCVGMMDSAELAGEIVAAMEALERIKGTTGKWCVHCSRAEGDHTDNCPAGIATRALAAHSASAASAANDGPVVQASPETREMLAAMTAKWPAAGPAPEPVSNDWRRRRCDTCKCRYHVGRCGACGCDLRNYPVHSLAGGLAIDPAALTQDGTAFAAAPEPVKPPRLGICPACHRSDCICADPTVPAAEPGKPMEWTVCPTCGGPDLRVVAAVQGLTCGALANDGTACTRLPHPESPDYHTDGTEYCWIGGTGRTPAAGDSAITMSGCELVDCDRPEPHTHQGRCEHPSPGDGSCDNCRCADAPGGTRP